MKRRMNILVACEESQEVCMAFRAKGHNAFSCDIQDCSGGHPEWHIKGDVTKLLKPFKYYDEYWKQEFVGFKFMTCDGALHYVRGKWDMIIAFPPCTHLAVSGARYFEKKRTDGRQREAIEFFTMFLEADCDRISIENPVNIITGGKYLQKWFPDLCKKHGIPTPCTQKIQPYEFGHKTKKTTCLWLKGLEKLKPTNIVEPEIVTFKGNRHYGVGIGQIFDENGKAIPFHDPRTAKARSKTFRGIALAMADQWG